MKKIQIAVRDFALPIPRTGSIEVNSGYGAIPLSGKDVHAAVQRQRQKQFRNYQSEVRVSQNFYRDQFTFVVSGHIDGLIEGESPVIEEIKTSFDLADLQQRLVAQDDHPYCMQLKTYLYLYARQFEREPSGRFLLASARSDDTIELPIKLNIENYEEWLEKRLDELAVETKAKLEDENRRKLIANIIRFPFSEPRKNQLDLIEFVEDNLKQNDPLMIQASTGLGKTAGIMYPALKESLSRGQKLVYVTAKNSQHKVAEDAVKRLQKQSKKLRALTITAKSKICLKEEMICNPSYCQYARDYYAKVYNEGLLDKLTQHTHLNAAKFREYGERYEVCPFELSVDSLSRADIVISDYNYVYSPRSLLGRLTQPGAPKSARPNLVIDEAHNLPARAADYYSASLSTQTLENIKSRLTTTAPVFQNDAGRLIEQLKRLILECGAKAIKGEAQVFISQGHLADQEEQAKSLLSAYLKTDQTIHGDDPIMELCSVISEFAAALNFEGENFFTTFRKTYSGATLKISCSDASEKLKAANDAFAHIVGFSATLKPFEYYARLSGFDPERTKTVEFESPFPKDNRKLMVIPQVSTKYSDRNRFYPKIAEAIERITDKRKGNYFVFFPSFEFLDQVHALSRLTGFTVLRQTREMKTREVNEYIETLLAQRQPTIIFAVQGGVFSEGVDYPGDSVIGAIIVGPGLPNFSLERELLREYYEKNYGSGFDYAYTYPAMTKVIQSAGRVIRSESDSGLIVLMDKRFTEPSYVKAMPTDWFEGSVQELVSDKILSDVAEFWSARSKS